MITIDKLCYNSKLRYVNAGEKFAFAVITLLLCVMSRSIAVACIVLAVTGILTVYRGGIPFFRYIHFMSVPLAFLILSTLAIMFNLSHTPLDLFAIPVGTWYITSSWESFFYAVQLILTALASVSCLYFLSFNTPMPDIMNVLGKMHCPKLLVELMMLIYRFIFVLLSVSSAITQSQHSRLGNKDYKTSLKSFGAMASVLLLRSFKRANVLYDAMESRCYDGTLHVLNENYPPSRKHIWAIIIFDTLLLLFIIGKGIFL
ncbi:MAG: cobalt ECF transporter T component CbiQ [Clostridia bacterium]|nr:cobalt ECF transporter T component CbiQ [Clostridia bacterium]NCC44680.1 cobalt ECF transporter T component CbiQ [Clostridia bacterium]